MNAEQAKSLIRWMVATFGPFIIAQGYASQSTLELWSGVLVSLAPLVWSMFTHTQANAVAVVDMIAKEKNSPVKAVLTESTTAGRALAQSMPGDTTVVAGTQAATAAAKP